MKYCRLFYSITLLHILLTLSGCSTQPLNTLWEKESPPTVVVPLPKRLHAVEDKLLLIEVKGLIDQAALMEKVEVNDKNRHQVILLKEKISNLLIEKEKELLFCGLYHQDKKTDLALACAQLAKKIIPSYESDNIVKNIHRRLAKKTRQKKETQIANIKRQRDSLIMLAKKHISQSNFLETAKILNQVFTISPDDDEANQLLKELQPIQEKRATELASMGDRLYRNEKIEQALAAWRAASKLSLNDKEIQGKIDRAERVLGSVKKIKNLPKGNIENTPQTISP